MSPDGREADIAVLVRAVAYAALFVGLVLVFLPGRVLSWTGITRPVAIGVPQVAGMVVGAVGAALALWCVLTFALVGRGTSAPFDSPRRLVVQGPYRVVRNPMYIGAGWPSGVLRSSINRAPSSAIRGCSSFSPTCLCCGTKSPRCGGPSGQSTKPTAGGSAGGGQDYEGHSPLCRSSSGW